MHANILVQPCSLATTQQSSGYKQTNDDKWKLKTISLQDEHGIVNDDHWRLEKVGDSKWDWVPKSDFSESNAFPVLHYIRGIYSSP